MTTGQQPGDTRRPPPRREQQQALISVGLHPLSLLGPQLRLHPAAPADGLDGDAGGARCGGCTFRRRIKLTGQQLYPKCTFPARAAAAEGQGPAGDVRAWWPACVDYQPCTNGGREAGPS